MQRLTRDRAGVVVVGVSVLLAGLVGCSGLGEVALVPPPEASPWSTSPLDVDAALSLPVIAEQPMEAAVGQEAALPTSDPETPTPLAVAEPPAAPESAEVAVDDQAEPYDPFATEEPGAEDYDPWEPFNAKMFEFNRNLDRYLIKPVAQAYEAVVPDPVERAVQRSFLNLHFVPRFLNNLFQGKVKGAGIELSRFVINSTVGVAGFFDVASKLGLETPYEDTGQTLAVWGIKPGPYLILPFFPQPLTVRDAVGYVGDIVLNPVYYFLFSTIRMGQPAAVTHQTTASLATTGLTIGQLVNDRSISLEKFQGVEEATLDLYSAVRNAYLQAREKAIRE